MAAALANNAFVALCYHRAGDIKAIAHLGQTSNRPLRRRSERNRACVVPGCGATHRLEIDHIQPWATKAPPRWTTWPSSATTTTTT